MVCSTSLLLKGAAATLDLRSFAGSLHCELSWKMDESTLTIDAERTLTVTEVDGTTTRHRPDRRSPRSSDDDDSAGER